MVSRPDNIQFTKDQLTELLTNYGEVICIVIDGWGSKWGRGPHFEELPFKVLADHIHSIQPNCLVINHSCRTDLSLTQLVHYEATHGQHCPNDNTIPSQQGPTLQSTWFWEKGYEKQKLKSVESVIHELNFANTRTCNYLLNAAPNDKGLMDANVVNRLTEIGGRVKLRAPDKQLPAITPVHQGVKVTASSVSEPKFAASNVVDADLFTRWQCASDDTERWVELDFGKPMTFNRVICGEFQGRVQSFKIEALIGEEWRVLTKGGRMTFNFNRAFEDVTAQRFRLTVLEFSSLPMIAELTFVKY